MLPLIAVVPNMAWAESMPTASSDDARLPGFDGRTLDGKPLSTTAFAGQRLILFCFNPGIEQAAVYAEALANVSAERAQNNFAIAGVAMGLDADGSKAFAAKHRLDFPIFDDSDGDIALRLSLKTPVMLVGSDPEGRVSLAMLGFEHGEDIAVSAVEGRIRDFLRLPRIGLAATGKLEESPAAPLFEAEPLSGDKPFRLADAGGKPVVLTFFLSTCSHCQDALRFFKSELARLPDATRPVFVGVAIDAHAYSVESELESKRINFFQAYGDADHKIAEAYGSFARVPDIVLIDGARRIVHRKMGWDAKHDPDVMRMWLAKLAGNKVPMLLHRDWFSGNDSCAVCHQMEAATWRFTQHAGAFDTLVANGSDRDPKCIGCHVVGFGQRGGYTEKDREPYLENVGCEDCHGRGGGHLTPKPKTAAVAGAAHYQPACLKCHDAQHSLGFDYEKFRPKISHSAILALRDEDRAKLVAGRSQPRDLLPTTSAIVGSAACKSCHESEYAIWATSAHAHSVESLEKKNKAGDAACVRCHVTGYGRAGGFPEGKKANPSEDLARVGCESCHGPGADHVKDGGKTRGTILGLADKCESCVILQVCGTCHDEANDPGFRFNVAKKIDAQRHGKVMKAGSPAH